MVVIILAARWYLRFGLSYLDVKELLAERGIEVDHVTVYRWVQGFSPLLADAARPCRHVVGDRWYVDESYVKVVGRSRYGYRAIDQYGQIIDVYVSPRRDMQTARRFFKAALDDHGEPAEVVSDRLDTPRRRRRADPGHVSQHRAVREQSDRVRPRSAQGAASSDARRQT